MIKYLIAVMMLFTFFSEMMAHNNPYAIRNIEVKKTRSSSAEAKEAAITEARRQAFHVLLKKLVTSVDFEILKNTDDENIEFLIDSVQSVNEQLTRKAYKAAFSFEFNRLRVETFLREKSVAFFSAAHKPILILPVLSDGTKSYLFEKENIWFELWNRHTFNNTVLTFVVPQGDLDDIQLLNAEDALIGAAHKLKELTKKYHPETIIVPYVSFMKVGGELNVNLTFQEFDENGTKKISDLKPHNVTERAASASKTKILEKLLENTILSIQASHQVGKNTEGAHHTLYLKLKTNSAKVYYEYLRLLENSRMVSEIKPLELSREYSILKVVTTVDGQKLIEYFAQHGLHFELIDQGSLPPYLSPEDRNIE